MHDRWIVLFLYPRQFNDKTIQGKDLYPVYRRRDNGTVIEIRGSKLDIDGLSRSTPSFSCDITAIQMLSCSLASRRSNTSSMTIGMEDEHLWIIDTLNIEQRVGFDLIMEHEKTYLYKALLAKVRPLD